MSVKDQLLPADGVYAGRAAVAGEVHRAAISIGHTPTFGGTDRQVEAFLLDFDGQVYGESMRLEFDRLLRSQQSFESPEALVRQLHRDVESVRQDVGHLGPDAPSGEGRAK